MSAFSLSSLILCLSSIVFSAIVFRSDSKNKINRSWFTFSVAFSTWALSIFAVTSTASPTVALGWQYVLDISAILIPLFYIRFTFALTNISSRFILIASWIFALSLSVFSTTHLFKLGVAQKFDFFWVKPGEFYWLFPVYFGIGVLIAFTYLLIGYFQSKGNPLLHAQIRNTILSGLIGYIGGFTNFFPQIFNIYPFGNYLIIVYIIFMVYGVLKYKLLSTKVISAQLFSTALLLVLLFNLLRSNLLAEWTTNFIVFIFAGFISFFLIKSVNKEVKIRQEVEALAKDLSLANDRLKELDAQKTEFVSLASHQLRGPLTVIKGYGSMLLEGDFGEMSPTVTDSVEKIYKSTQDLVVIVGDYLDVSRIEQGRMQYDFSSFDLKELVCSLVTEFTPSITAAHLTIDFDITERANNKPFIINADKGKIKQVLSNLIDNSIKYTPNGGIHVWLSHRDEKKALVTISDTGVGIHPDVLPKLFNKFLRAPDASKTNILGTGLGLYIARKIVESHDGVIWAESAGIGKGSTFFVELELV